MSTKCDKKKKKLNKQVFFHRVQVHINVSKKKKKKKKEKESNLGCVNKMRQEE